MKISDAYIEFGGDPSDDSECYKRYCSTEYFDPVGLDAEVIHFISAELFDEQRIQLSRARMALNRIAILGSGEKAYTKEFTELANAISRKFLADFP